MPDAPVSGTTLTAVRIDGDAATVTHLGDGRVWLVRGDKVTRFDLPYPASREAPSPESVPEPETPRVFDVESVGTPPRDPDATTVIRRSDLMGDDEDRDGPEGAA